MPKEFNAVKKLLTAALAVAAVAAGTSAATAAPVVTTTNAISSSFADTFADPSIIQGRDGYWYAYATSDPLVANGPFGLMHMARTKDFSSWEYLGTVFTDQTKPAWAAPGSFFWAPDIRYFGGRYVMYFTVTDTAANPGGDPAIGVATAPTPAGPWTATDGPVVAPQPGRRRRLLRHHRPGSAYRGRRQAVPLLRRFLRRHLRHRALARRYACGRLRRPR